MELTSLLDITSSQDQAPKEFCPDREQGKEGQFLGMLAAGLVQQMEKAQEGQGVCEDTEEALAKLEQITDALEGVQDQKDKSGTGKSKKAIIAEMVAALISNQEKDGKLQGKESQPAHNLIPGAENAAEEGQGLAEIGASLGLEGASGPKKAEQPAQKAVDTVQPQQPVEKEGGSPGKPHRSAEAVIGKKIGLPLEPTEKDAPDTAERTASVPKEAKLEIWDTKKQPSGSLLDKQVQIQRPEGEKKDMGFWHKDLADGQTAEQAQSGWQQEQAHADGKILGLKQGAPESQKADHIHRAESLTNMLQGPAGSAEQAQWVQAQKQEFASPAVETVVMQVVRNKGTAKEIELKLEPESLGKVRVRVSCSQDKVDITIRTHLSQTQHILREGMESLRESLLEKGVEIGHLSVHMETYMKKNSENRSHHQQPGPSYNKKSMAQSEEDYDIQQKMTAAVHMAGGHHVNIII